MNTENLELKNQSVKELQAEARLLDIAGRSLLNKADLIVAIVERQKVFREAAIARNKANAARAFPSGS
jgi:hypothetical protein|tara:strand:- start:229 stop:432 length:204 start_codon:yes stop_codon:yes gene_type:complete